MRRYAFHGRRGEALERSSWTLFILAVLIAACACGGQAGSDERTPSPTASAITDSVTPVLPPTRPTDTPLAAAPTATPTLEAAAASTVSPILATEAPTPITSPTTLVGSAPGAETIAFASHRDGNDEIYLMDGDGSNQRNLTNRPNADDGGPAWSPDGTRLAFASYQDRRLDVFVINADGTGLLKVTSEPVDELAGGPEWSPDGRYLAFSSGTPGEKGSVGETFAVRVYAVDAAGATLAASTPGQFPVWAPVGDRVAFMLDADIHVMRADGSGILNLTHSEVSEFFLLEWTPDGEQIVFAHGSSLASVNADGSGMRIITELRGMLSDDFLSPDGGRVVFPADAGGNSDIFVVNVDGSGLVNLTSHPAHDGEPIWSPDGTRVSFVRDGVEFYVVDADGADGSGLTRLTGSHPTNRWWSPDGRRILFSREVGDPTIRSNLYAVNVDGTGEVALPTEGGYRPVWKP
jgi:TolB protein